MAAGRAWRRLPYCGSETYSFKRKVKTFVCMYFIFLRLLPSLFRFSLFADLQSLLP